MGWLAETDRVVGVDREIAGIDVVTLEYHFKNFWLMNSALLHETYYFVLLGYGLLYIDIKLNLDFILNLPGLSEEVLIFGGPSKVLTVLSKEVELANVCPGVESVSHWVHDPNANILATP